MNVVTSLLFGFGVGFMAVMMFVLGYKIGRATERERAAERARGYASATTSGPLRVVR